MADSNLSWIEVLAELRASRRPCAMVVVTEVQGSVPREPGARMLVCDGRLAWGTIGGGKLEQEALRHADELLRAPRPVSESVAYPLSEKVGQCCGGRVTLFYETFAWSRRRVAVFGAGHVAQALGGLAEYLAADVVLIDDRDEAEIQPPVPERRPYELVCIDHPEEEVDGLPPGALVLVMTHSHALDLEVVARAARRDDLAYVGLIGSERKWQRFQKRLLQRGFTPEELARVRCPIGVSKGSKDPRAIAVSTAAELLDVLEAAERRDAPAAARPGGESEALR